MDLYTIKFLTPLFLPLCLAVCFILFPNHIWDFFASESVQKPKRIEYGFRAVGVVLLAVIIYSALPIFNTFVF